MQTQLIKDIIFSVFDSLRSHKLRSALTLIGVVIGTAVVVTVGAVLTGLSQRVADVTEKNSPNVIYFTKEEKIGPGFSEPTEEQRKRKDFTYEDAIAISKLDKPLYVSPQKIRGSYGPTADRPKLTARGRSAINPLILGVWENYPDLISVRVARGRFFTDAEQNARAQVAIIGSGVADQIFEATDPLGEDVRVDGKLYRVIGVLASAAGEGVIGSDDLDGRVVYIPFETAEKNYPEIEAVLIAVRAPAGMVDEVIDQVTYTLRTRRNVPVEKQNDFGVNKSEQIFEVVNQLLAGLASIIVPIALAGLLVGGVGVMNIMLVTVTERTAEIGVRRALGARQRDILTQFLIEAATLTSVGGVIGILIGFVLAFILQFVIKFPAAVPLWAIIVGFLTSTFVGIIAGMWPAIRAARLDPVEAIRGV